VIDSVKVFAPASVANLACGFDILGLALEAPGDEIIARFNPESKELKIVSITGDEGRLPRDIESNTAGFAAHQFLNSINYNGVGIDLEIHKKMPFGSGLGSSAASAVGAVFAVSQLLGGQWTKNDLLPFAVLGEQQADGAYHADNVAPSLFGGIVLIRDNHSLDVMQLPVPDDLTVAVIHPQIEILTKEARSILASTVPLRDHIVQSGHLGSFIVGLYTNDFERIHKSVVDVVIEPQRARQIPHFYTVKSIVEKLGALGCSISGSGPSIFAFCRGVDQAGFIAERMGDVYGAHGIAVDIFSGKINTQGVQTIE